MNAKDRTEQFRRMALQEKGQNPSRTLKQFKPPPSTSLTQFKTKIQKTETMNNKLKHELKDLQNLSNDATLLNDNEEQISRLCHLIKRDLEITTQGVESASRVLKSSQEQETQLSRNALTKCKSDLASSAKLFHEILSGRTKKLRRHQQRRQNYSKQNSFVPRDFSQLRNDEILEEQTPNGNQMQQMQQMQKERETTRNESYLNSRLKATQGIEETISELSAMYQRLASLVAVQDETCSRLDFNTEVASSNVTEGHRQLEKFYVTTSSNRLLITKVFSMLLFMIALVFLITR